MKKYLILIIGFISFSCSSDYSKLNGKNNDGGLLKLKVRYDFNKPPSLGFINELEVFEGGFSGLHYIKGSDLEFYTINDRGPNLEVNEHPKANGSNVKFFPFPDYSQKLLRFKVKDESIKIISSRPLKATEEINFSGLSPQKEEEISWINLEGLLADSPEFFMDAEALVFDNSGNVLIADEYGPSIFVFDTGNVLLRHTFSPIETKDKYKLPPILQLRQPNRGFEGLTINENGEIFAILQSPLDLSGYYADIKFPGLIRVLKINSDSSMQFYFYPTGDSLLPNTEVDWKIGDICHYQKDEFLVIEHANVNGDKVVNICLIKLSVSRTDLIDTSTFSYDADLSNDLEELNINKINPVQKIVLGNILLSGYDKNSGKPEGIAILNDTTIAIMSDNDYGIEFNSQLQKVEESGKMTSLYIFNVSKPLNEIYD